jgi:hypothetical protein
VVIKGASVGGGRAGPPSLRSVPRAAAGPAPAVQSTSQDWREDEQPTLTHGLFSEEPRDPQESYRELVFLSTTRLGSQSGIRTKPTEVLGYKRDASCS